MKKLILSTFVIFCFTFTSLSAQTNTLVVNTDKTVSKISRHIYGMFAEHLGHGIYGGLWVGEDSNIPNTDGWRNDVVNALKKLDVPNVRWPGGCYADTYHWRDGIGPRDERPTRVNMFWGEVPETNAVGTHEFMRLTELLNTEPYFSANVGSGSPREMMYWLEYMTYGGNSTLANLRRKNGREKPWNIKFWGIGNESWGCGGNMTADYFANLFRRFATYAHDYTDNQLYIIASGYDTDQYNWTETLMKKAGWLLDAISLHYYTIPTGNWGNKGPSTDFGEASYFATLQKSLKIEEFVQGHIAVLDRYDPEGRVALAVDEWGVWTNPLSGTNPGFLRQQNSLRDALVASTTLDIFNEYSRRVRIANIAQMVNVLQAMILTKDEKMIKTPTYYVFKMYKVHHDAMLLGSLLGADKYSYEGESIRGISATASKDDNGTVHLTVTNLHAQKAQTLTVKLRGMDIQEVSGGRVLTAESVDAINTFENPDHVKPVDYTDYTVEGNTLTLQLPSKSVIVLTIK